jgi:hypothetical protein
VVSSFAKPSISNGSSTGTVLLEVPGKPASAATLSLANVSAGVANAGLARLAAAAFQSIRARETCGVFISSAAAGAAISKARPTSTARFNPASLVLTTSAKARRDSNVEVKFIALRHTRV